VVVDGILRTLIYRIINFHDGGLITASVAIVRSRKDRDDLSVVLPLISLHDKLMSTRNEMEAVDMSELLRNVLSKGVTSSPR
jgi:hypothetical protein